MIYIWYTWFSDRQVLLGSFVERYWQRGTPVDSRQVEGLKPQGGFLEWWQTHPFVAKTSIEKGPIKNQSIKSEACFVFMATNHVDLFKAAFFGASLSSSTSYVKLRVTDQGSFPSPAVHCRRISHVFLLFLLTSTFDKVHGASKDVLERNGTPISRPFKIPPVISSPEVRIY